MPLDLVVILDPTDLDYSLAEPLSEFRLLVSWNVKKSELLSVKSLRLLLAVLQVRLVLLNWSERILRELVEQS